MASYNMQVQSGTKLPYPVQFQNLVGYLESTGWKRLESIGVWLVFGALADVNGNPIEIVLPANPQTPDLKRYLANALEVLATVQDTSIERVASFVHYFDRDVLRMRNLETGREDSIELKFAAQQVFQLKNLIGYAACSEQNPKPDFNELRGAGLTITERYHFGHTFRGSFGFTVESPPLGEVTILEARQDSFFPDMEKAISILPLGRRVMERVIRGLLLTHEATQRRDVSVIVNNYGSGFNAKMCTSVLQMSKNKTMPLEYEVQWSPKIGPSSDLEELRPIRLDATSYQFLEEAEAILSTLEPEVVQVRGTVVALRSRQDPLESSSTRSVVIRWANRPEGEKPVDVVVPLDAEDYRAASEAHLSYQLVEVTGVAQKVGSTWRLAEPSNFQRIGGLPRPHA